MDGKGPWAQPGEYRRPKAELEAAKAEKRWYKEAARQRGWKPERQPQKRHTGSVVKPSRRPAPTSPGFPEREGPGRHRVMRWSSQSPQCVCITRCGTFQLLVLAGLECASSQVP